jgi:hypothetical protein
VRGEHGAPTLDLEHLHAERLLQVRDGVAHGRLAAMQRDGRFGVAAMFDDGGQYGPLLGAGFGNAHINQ